MRKIVFRILAVSLAVGICLGGYVGWRALGVYQTLSGGFQHLRYLLESGETVEGAPADDVLSDTYLLSLFGDNPELVERLKTVVDLGMATDANLKLGSVSVMVVTYRKGADNAVMDPAIYAVGGFPDPKSKRLGFHSTGYFKEDLDPSLWYTGNAVMNLLGRDIIVFCEQEKAEAHMALLYDLLNGNILPLAQRIAETPLYYAIVFPSPKELAPPHLRTKLQTVLIKGEMDGDRGKTDTMFVSSSYTSAAQVNVLMKDMISLARITFRDRYGGYIKDMNFGIVDGKPWGKMNDTWWAVEYVDLLDNLKLVQDQIMVIARVEYDRFKNNAILKTIERAGRDMAMQKAFVLSSELPWEFAFQQRNNPSGGYWSAPHRWGREWPLGDEGIATAGSRAAAAERERLRAEEAARKVEASKTLEQPAEETSPVAAPEPKT